MWLSILCVGVRRRLREEIEDYLNIHVGNKDLREVNQRDRRSIQREVYTQYCGYNAKMEGYTQCGYNANLG